MVINWQRIKKNFADTLVTGVGGLIEGAAEDVQRYLAEIAKDAVNIQAAGGDEEELSILKEQLDMLAAKHQIALGKVANSTLVVAIDTAVAVLSGIASGGSSLLGGLMSD